MPSSTVPSIGTTTIGRPVCAPAARLATPQNSKNALNQARSPNAFMPIPTRRRFTKLRGELLRGELLGDDLTDEVAVDLAAQLRHDDLHHGAGIARIRRQLRQNALDDGADLRSRTLRREICLKDLAFRALLLG